jgi:cyanophycinase
MITPVGKLIAIGGNEDKGSEEEPNILQSANLNFFALGILKRIIAELKNDRDSHIEVITTASKIPVEVGELYKEAFCKLDCKNVNILHIPNRAEANQEEYLERIKRADCVLFSGGNQLRLGMIFGGTEFLNVLYERYNYDEFVIAGTSAGAMAMSNPMIYLGSSLDSHLKGTVKITTGFGFVKNVIIDSHFDKRGRFGRLAQAVATNPSAFGVGLGEDTGILITEGTHLEVIGSGMVVIIDGHEINFTNIADIPLGTPISLENLIVHFLAKGDKYELTERHFSAHSAS